MTQEAQEQGQGTMTKSDIVQEVYKQGAGLFTKRESADLVDLVFTTIKDQLAEGAKIKISGFGNFEVRQKNPRAGRNPQTGDKITIEGRRILKFKPSQILKENLNEAD
jgi:integration host factor subunit alpha